MAGDRIQYEKEEEAHRRLQSQLAALNSSTSRIVDLCRHALGLAEGCRFQLGMRETVNYLDEISLLLEKIEIRKS
jgi:hypothetical protein